MAALYPITLGPKYPQLALDFRERLDLNECITVSAQGKGNARTFREGVQQAHKSDKRYVIEIDGAASTYNWSAYQTVGGAYPANEPFVIASLDPLRPCRINSNRNRTFHLHGTDNGRKWQDDPNGILHIVVDGFHFEWSFGLHFAEKCRGWLRNNVVENMVGDCFLYAGGEQHMGSAGFSAFTHNFVRVVHNRLMSNGKPYHGKQHGGYWESEFETTEGPVLACNVYRDISRFAFGHMKAQKGKILNAKVFNNFAMNAAGLSWDHHCFGGVAERNTLYNTHDARQLWSGLEFFVDPNNMPFLHMQRSVGAHDRNVWRSDSTGHILFWCFSDEGSGQPKLSDSTFTENRITCPPDSIYAWDPTTGTGDSSVHYHRMNERFPPFLPDGQLNLTTDRLNLDRNSPTAAVMEAMFDPERGFTVGIGPVAMHEEFWGDNPPPPPPPPPPEEGVYYVSGTSHCVTCGGSNRNDAPPDFRHYAEQETVEIRQGTLVRGDLTSAAETLTIRNGLWGLKDEGATVLEGDVYVLEGVDVTFEGVTHDGVVHQGDTPPPPPPPPPDELEQLRQENAALREDMKRIEEEKVAMKNIITAVKDALNEVAA